MADRLMPSRVFVGRRVFVGGLTSGILARPRIGRAQSARRVPRVGIVNYGVTSEMVGPSPRSPSISALLSGLRDLGLVYERDFVTEPRGAERSPERVRGLADELVRLRVDMIVASGVTLPAVKQATTTIPVVMVGSDDPVARGHVRSLAHPGGNITGLSTQGVETAAKRIDLLKELVPAAAPVAVIWDQSSRPIWQATEAAALMRGWKLLSLELRDAGDIETAFGTAAKARAPGIVVAANRLTLGHVKRIVELAVKSRLAAMYELRGFVEAGGLVSYGVNEIQMWRRSATFVAKILKGAKPSDLPVEQVNTFELVINLKAAKAIGLTIPQLMLLRADEILK